MNDLTWVHYLAYGPSSPICIPLSDMGAVKEESRDKGAALQHSYFRFAHESRRTLIDHIDAGRIHWGPLIGSEEDLNPTIARTVQARTGVRPMKPALPGWLTLRLDEAEKLLPAMTELMRVYVLESAQDNLELTRAAGIKQTVQPKTGHALAQYLLGLQGKKLAL